MNNKIIYQSQTHIETIREQAYSNDDVFYVEVNGRECKRFSDYLVDISHKLYFPTVVNGFAGYDDWITDLTWLRQNNIIMVISNYQEFLKDDMSYRKKIIEHLEQSVLPWWETEVSSCVVEGKPKTFIVYLLD